MSRPIASTGLTARSLLRVNLVPLMEEYGVDVCISGHPHEYERGFLNGVYYVTTRGRKLAGSGQRRGLRLAPT